MEIKEKVQNLPKKPGVYLMLDNSNAVIYVGKAKNLKNRVSSYFGSTTQNVAQPHSFKTATMVGHIADFEYIVTDTELEALVLECNLIKKHMPKYNILLKDDKGYSYIKVTNEPFPRIIRTRKTGADSNSNNDGSKYFGPYLDGLAVKTVLDTIKKIFQVRDCNRQLPKKIGAERPCINYSIQQCSAPCNSHISQEEYAQVIGDACDFLAGKHTQITSRLEREMQEFSAKMEFERAAKNRDKLIAINKIHEKQKITSTNLDNKDVIAFAKNKKDVCIQVFFIRNGKMLGRDNFFLKNLIDDDDSTILAGFIKQYYAYSTQIPRRIMVSGDIEEGELLEEWLTGIAETKISITTPQRGVNFDLVNMVKQNAVEALQIHQLGSNVFQKKADTLLFEVKELLGLETAPMRIEAYDISHTSGADSVGVRVVFENAAPLKSAYRKYNIEGTQAADQHQDDYAAIREVLTRRFAKTEEEDALPDLLLIDGGRGHVSTAKEAAKDAGITLPIYGIVKDDKHRTRGITTEDQELTIPITSKSFRFFTKIQDEVHRFALASHRAKHKNSTLASELMTIKGIGKARQAILLKAFGTPENIKKATIEELSNTKGMDEKTAKAVWEHYKKDKK